MSASKLAADMMEHAGLARRTIFTKTQLPNACGYDAAAWACELRALGLAFQTYPEEEAAAYNTPEFIQLFNDDLGHPSAGGEAFWLSDDQIQQLATIHNPDRPHTSPSWLHGPAPINFWEKHFARTLVQPAQHGRVHIMVVNTEEQLTLDATASGLHWFVIAWFIEPKPDGAAAASGP